MHNNRYIFKKILGWMIVVNILSVAAYAGTFNNAPDTGKKLLLASLDKRHDEAYITVGPNVVYPTILAGHEEKTLGYVEKFADERRGYLIRTHTKGKKIFPKAAAILKRYKVPEELKVLLELESAFNGNAVSRAGAVGYWQFMDAAAKEYGLKIVPQTAKTKGSKKDKKALAVKDDRKDLNRSTAAAARYLNDRCRNLDDDWLLIVASYNCGIGNVWNAMANCRKKDPDFWDIKNYLPVETRTYVMNFIALNVIYK